MLSFKVKLICDPVAQANLKTSPLRGVNNYEFGPADAVESAWQLATLAKPNNTQKCGRKCAPPATVRAETVGNRQ